MVRLTVRERVETAAARALLQLPAPAVRMLAGPPIVRDGRTLDPQVQLVLRAHKLSGARLVHEVPLAVARRDLEVSGHQLERKPPPALASIEELTLDLGDRALPARVYRPHGVTSPAPALVYFHGGGYACGSLHSHDGVCRILAASTPCVVVAVDYRLAPEHRFPAAADDGAGAFRAVVARASALGIDEKRIAVGGDSAGGNLATVLSLETRADAVRPCAQLLVYPSVDLTMSFPSVTSLGTGFFLEKPSIAWFRDNYLAGADVTHPRASPWFAADVSGMPPAIVVTAGFDPLRDEGDAWAARLAAAGVTVEHRSYPGLFHGFLNTTGVIHAARAAVAEMAALLHVALVGAGAPSAPAPPSAAARS